jgi:hypothetical protein
VNKEIPTKKARKGGETRKGRDYFQVINWGLISISSIICYTLNPSPKGGDL